MNDFIFAQQSRYSRIPPTWILLDSCSKVSVFNNPIFLHNIRAGSVPLTINTNGGSHNSSMLGDLAGFGMVWYNPSSLANILLLKDVRKVRRVVMDSDVEWQWWCINKTVLPSTSSRNSTMASIITTQH